jgi:hypothetical protein
MVVFGGGFRHWSLHPPPWEQFPVAVERDRDRGVTHEGLESLCVDSRSDHQARVRVAALMKGDRFQPGRRPSPRLARFATDHGSNDLLGVRPKTRACASAPRRVASSGPSATGIGTVRVPAADFGATSPATRSQLRRTRMTRRLRSTSLKRSACSSPRLRPACSAVAQSGRSSGTNAERSAAASRGSAIRSRRPRTAGSSGSRAGQLNWRRQVIRPRRNGKLVVPKFPQYGHIGPSFQHVPLRAPAVGGERGDLAVVAGPLRGAAWFAAHGRDSSWEVGPTPRIRAGGGWMTRQVLEWPCTTR